MRSKNLTSVPFLRGGGFFSHTGDEAGLAVAFWPCAQSWYICRRYSVM